MYTTGKAFVRIILLLLLGFFFLNVNLTTTILENVYLHKGKRKYIVLRTWYGIVSKCTQMNNALLTTYNSKNNSNNNNNNEYETETFGQTAYWVVLPVMVVSFCFYLFSGDFIREYLFCVRSYCVHTQTRTHAFTYIYIYT